MSKKGYRRKKKEKKVTFVSFFSIFGLHLFDMWIMYQLRINVIFLQLLEKVTDIFKSSREPSDIRRNFQGGFWYHPFTDNHNQNQRQKWNRQENKVNKTIILEADFWAWNAESQNLRSYSQKESIEAKHLGSIYPPELRLSISIC